MMAKAARVWGQTEAHVEPSLSPFEEEAIRFYNILIKGEGRIPLADIKIMCEENGVVDIAKMIELVKAVEGEVQTVGAEERERKMKRG